ncbi:Fumarylacetoacetate (FAA) hydrolase family protein [Arthrobacter subterraneus]|uniref:Fumarylacetoacetate (FAA) hydrolase family protein n=1 Tax=Arthrobacter subterraneus TaxID=335973 RepID=A0A1G8KXX2_9MICC|nr:fumarylacetoacetate hydrolase family protein [Arthrobacter subterraneus]SDI48232.1 Fumarylacetoacetate (FAA) hydrolase family protein [Arthrobacter subterraneus]
MTASISNLLPDDADQALLVGRLWDPETGGPRPVLLDGNTLVDLFDHAATVSELLNGENPAALLEDARSSAARRWDLADVAGAAMDDDGVPHLLAPVDLQAVKACGVTFVDSMIERVIEERCAGDFTLAEQMRAQVHEALGGSLAGVRPGSPEAARVKEVLVREGFWSQYLEVGIGPDPEVFSKAPVLSAVGTGARIGIPSFSSWNNPEPELVLVVDSTGRVRGCTLGNDVNLRDVEGRSALLLGMAKDNNGSAALGPFVRLFNASYTLDDARRETIHLTVTGTDGYTLNGTNSVERLSRPFEELVGAAYGTHHQYPDGFVLFTGTLFAPNEDRDAPGMGFTHKTGDVVEIRSERLGTLTNMVAPTEDLEPWRFGIGSQLQYILAQKRTDMARAQ